MRVPNPLRVLVLGAVCVSGALGSTAAGAEATAHPSAANVDALVQLAMSTPARGFGLFTSSGGRDCQDVVGATTNGGATFGGFHLVQRWACHGVEPQDDLVVDGAGDLFVYGHGFFASHDLGATWVPVPHQGHVLQVVAEGRSLWLVEADCRPPVGPTCPLRVATSSDGGRTWAPTPSQPDGAVGYSSTQTPVAGETWLVRSGAKAYVISHGVLRYASEESNPIWATEDDGASWTRRSLRCAAGVGSLVVSSAPDGTLFAVCGSGVSAGSESKSTSVSVNGGVSWHVSASCLTDRAASRLCEGYLGEVDAVTGRRAYVIGWRSPLHVSLDGGAAWGDAPGVGNTNGGPAQVDFFDAADGFVLGSDGSAVAIWHTADGGRHWRLVLPRVVH